MKLRLLMALASAVLFLAPKTAGALDGQPGAGLSGSARMEQNANESVQAITDISFGETGQEAMPAAQPMQNVSYGGAAGGQSQTGGRQDRPCSGGPQCRVYFGQ
jgi:hypothetical protein